MPGLESGAVYVPAFVSEGRPVAGPDEDAFTLVATVLERLSPTAPGSPSARLVHLVGSFPPVVEWGLPALLGHPVALVVHKPGLVGLEEALDQVEASGRDSSPQLVLVAQLPERATEDSATASGGGAGAVAVRFGGGGAFSAEARKLWLQVPDLVAGADALLGSQGIAPPVSPGHRPLSLDRIRSFVEAPPLAVSEGAYVPRARYLENLPSRWRLVAERCGHCGSLTFPARGVCRSCSAREGLTPHQLPLDGGTVVAATTIGQGGQPTEFDPQVAALGEYAVVLVALSPGICLTLQVTDAAPGELPIGARVRTRLRRLYPMEGEWRYGRKAIPFA